MTLTTALTKSINSVPVRLAKDYLSIPVIKAKAIAMGVESPLEDHKTMVLGTSGMTVMDQATGYNTLADGGFAGTRHAITQLMKRSGEVFYDYDRDAPKPKRVVTEKAVSEMNSMLVQVPEIGTARRAALPSIRSAGKTGTTQSYRDAWYVGFTGNYTAAVWMGNDDFHPTRDMTGGSLPAMTWQRLMEYAHKNIDLKPIPGIENPFVDEETAAKAAEAEKLRGGKERAGSTRQARGAVARDDQAAQGNVGALPRSAADRRAAGTKEAVGALTSGRGRRRSHRPQAAVRRRKRLAKPVHRRTGRQPFRLLFAPSPGYPLTAPSPASSASCSEPFS